MNPQILLLTATATGLPVAIFADRIVAVAAHPKLDNGGRPMTDMEAKPLEKGCSIALDGVTEPLFVEESLGDILRAFTHEEV